MPLGHLKISQGNLEDILGRVEDFICRGKRAYCVPLNLTKYVLAKQDDKLKKVIQEADIIIADGMPIYWFSRRLGYDHVYRVTGIELAERIFLTSKEKKWTIFFLGSTPENLDRAVKEIEKKYHLKSIIGFRDGYFSNEDIPKLLLNINSLQPDVLLLGLGMPQKEYFISDYLYEIKVKFCLPVGGAFDIWAGKRKRSPLFIQKAGLEWLFRASFDNQKGKNIFKYGAAFLKDFLFYRS
ncbi:MAG: WecB/TagA/CpsF family glycosyltransferase [Candidatus Jordarchaeum sp.]|uniref:WecB/TagA/CpsF family glycosyltransferase n=1 Tax=Candidatus Jordarchaeum sp. TaxID=2823881 RepID=UPI00404AD9F0